MTEFKRYIQKYDIVDLGFTIHPWFPVDIQKIQEWYNNLEKNYQDWKFLIGENQHVWETKISDPTGHTGHILPDNTGYYTLCWNSEDSGPKPFEQGCAKIEYKDNDNNLLNPRKCFDGYALEIINSMPIPSKKWVVADHVPGTKLITHQDSPDKIRVHIPIYTNDDSFWIIQGIKFHMKPGWAYLVNTSLPHSVENNGKTNRVHLYGKVWTKDVLGLSL